MSGRIAETLRVQLARSSAAVSPDPAAYDLLLQATALIETGRMEQARREVAEIRRRSPGFSIELLTQRLDPAGGEVVQHAVRALREAGLE